MGIQIKISDPTHAIKIKIPVQFTLDQNIEGDLWLAKTDQGEEVLCQRLQQGSVNSFITVVSLQRGEVILTLERPVSVEENIGIREISTKQEQDCYVRLNTGMFDLELCRGNAQGEGASKWGLRHFKSLAENKDLLPSGNNAIGGFYGPFFTPDNGLINPAEHLVVDIVPMEDGPVFKKYKLFGSIPSGLKSELRNKRFTVEWSFYYNTSFFSRIYKVDHFETVVNGRSVVDKITVGDEFESGVGQLVFDRFDSYDGTWYRAGDPYANKLAEKVQYLIQNNHKGNENFKRIQRILTGDMASAHWDLYWRLFSVWEKALSDAEIEHYLQTVRQQAFVLADLNNRPWCYSSKAVEVKQVAEQTIFAGPATKTAEFNTKTGQAMIWQTGHASGAFQIVQRPGSGWQNWGTNGENECPALPVGTLIHTAYGPYAQCWRDIADSLEALSQLITIQANTSLTNFRLNKSL